MSSNNDPAFPSLDPNLQTGERLKYVAGLSKREFMATLILQGLIANRGNAYSSKGDVQSAVRNADALIEELQRVKDDDKASQRRT